MVDRHITVPLFLGVRLTLEAWHGVTRRDTASVGECVTRHDVVLVQGPVLPHSLS